MKRRNPAWPAISSAFLLALLITGIAVLLSMLPSDSGILIPLILFVVSFLLIAYSYRILYRRFIFNDLISIYDNVHRLRYPAQPVPKLSPEKDPATEIRLLLVDWDTVSREEIDQLKQLENYRREFLSNVSHELKTPVFSIQGYIHTLIDGGIEDPDVNMHYLNKASKSMDRLISIVDDLESISRIESGMLVVEERTFDITELAKDVIESLDIQANEKRIRLILNADEKQHYVYADREMIRQVLVNLLVNSIKYGKPEGQTEIRFAEDAELLFTTVADDGIGMEKYHLPRLFERFYRVDKSRSREQGGTGLGLAIVKHIIEAHRQQITVDSEAGKGTAFTFSLKKSR